MNAVPPQVKQSHAVDAYGWQAAEGPASCSYIAPAIRRILQTLGPKRVLDLGCGNGALSAELQTDGYSVVGIDADAAGVAIAQAISPGARFYRARVEDDPRTVLAHEIPFDVVVSTEVIEHLYSPHNLLLFAHGALKPGGHLVLSTPYHGYLKNLAISLAGKWDGHFTALWHGGHIKFWSRNTIAELLNANGFTLERFHGVGRVPYLWKSMIVVARAT